MGASLMAVNIHHLELFFYVAKHGGVSAAARHIPYGVQQPAISAQIIQLEDSLGVNLFHRRPFELTAEGRELHAFIEPFFSGLPKLEERLSGGRQARLRIGAPGTILTNYVPRILKALRKSCPRLEFTLATGWQENFEAALLAGELDLAVTSIFGKSAPGVRTQVMVSLPLALLVPEKSPVRDAADFWRQDRIEEPLICVNAADPMCRTFQHELQKRGVEWFPAMEVGLLELVARYVTEGFGTGLVLDQPDSPTPPGTRRLTLGGFPALDYAVCWTGKASPLVEAFMTEARMVVTDLLTPGKAAASSARI